MTPLFFSSNISQSIEDQSNSIKEKPISLEPQQTGKIIRPTDSGQVFRLGPPQEKIEKQSLLRTKADPVVVEQTANHAREVSFLTKLLNFFRFLNFFRGSENEVKTQGSVELELGKSEQEKCGKLEGPAGRTYVVNRQLWMNYRQEGIQILEEERQQFRELAIKKGTTNPNSETLEQVALKDQRPNDFPYVLSMSAEKRKSFQLGRISLSKTFERSANKPKEIETWEKVDKMITQLVSEKTELTIDDIEKMQTTLNRTLIYLNEDNKNQTEEYVKWLNDQLKSCEKGEKNPIVVAAQAYRYFLNIHPYSDGNGRIGRFMMDLVLQRAGLPPANLSGSIVSGNVDLFVMEIENDINKLILAIKTGIVNLNQELNQPSPFK